MDLDWNNARRLLDRHFVPSALFLGTKNKTREPANGTDKLCAICAKHDFRKLFALVLDPLKQKKWEAQYSTAHAQANSQTCPFCRLLCQLAGALKPQDGTSAVRKTIHVTREYDDSFSMAGKSKKWHVPCLHVDSLERIQSIYQPEDDSRQLLRDRLFRARPLKQFVDVDLFEQWSRKCKEEHLECGKTGMGAAKEEWMEHDIRVIDVENNCVVKVTGPCEYVALSYVWGAPDIPQLKLVKSTAQRLFTEGGLSSSHDDVPSTISDAMEFSRRLGKKYLWVDAVCIEQDNPEDQGQQINQMHKIYINALFTIVAGYGYPGGPGIEESLVGNSWVGLPGVSKARDGQKIESVQGLQLVNLGWRFSRQMGASSWNYRAWTFQELQFSKRLVFFTQYQIFYRCDEALWREDQHLETDATIPINVLDSETESDPERHTFKQNFSGTNIDAFKLYRELVGGICERYLTNQDDILTAFSGIANKLKETMSCDFIWGLPSVYFDMALLFQSAARIPTSRRNGFPSWSWAGWLGPADTNIFLGLPRGPRMLYVTIDDTHQLYAEIEWYIIRKGEYVKISNSSVLQASSFCQSDAIRSSWRPPQLTSLPGSIPALSEQELDQLLVFQTSCAFVKVEDNTLRGGLYDVLFSADGNFRAINLRRNAPALIHRRMSPDAKTVTVEFIVVGTIAARPDAVVSNVTGESQTMKGYLSLMAIETYDNGTSQRIGIVDGKVDVQEWLDYKPKWRTIFLL